MTRMWMLPPEKMCRQHLLGEHKEIHQLIGCINAGRMSVLEGHARKNQIQTASIEQRHEELVSEMLRRGMNHKSPLPDYPKINIGSVDIDLNRIDLMGRCKRCFELFQ